MKGISVGERMSLNEMKIVQRKSVVRLKRAEAVVVVEKIRVSIPGRMRFQGCCFNADT
jgi:hypothetical protein